MSDTYDDILKDAASIGICVDCGTLVYDDEATCCDSLFCTLCLTEHKCGEEEEE